MTMFDYLAPRSRDRMADQMIVDDLVWSFRQACYGSGLFLNVDGRVAGPAFSTPQITTVHLGDPTTFVVRMLPGTTPAQLALVGRLIAPALGGIALKVHDRGHGWALVELLTRDPLAGVLPLVLPRAGHRVLIGRTDDGRDVEEDWRGGAHTVVQGVTRSGKSVWTYGTLAQLAGQPDVTIAGCDPTGILLRPFAGTKHESWQVSGMADLGAYEQLFTRLVEEMQGRIDELPDDRDTIELGPDRPLIVIVLEEWAAILRTADAAKTKEHDSGKIIRALVARLLAESAKVGMRVIILVQRAEAAVIGSFERAMCSLRISFRCDNPASVELLHPGAPKPDAEAHTAAEPGIALITQPGALLQRMRAPYLGGYPQYAAAVRSACAP